MSRRGLDDVVTLAEASRRMGKPSEYLRIRKHRFKDREPRFPEPAGIVGGMAAYRYGDLVAWDAERLAD